MQAVLGMDAGAVGLLFGNTFSENTPLRALVAGEFGSVEGPLAGVPALRHCPGA
jgi:hypothetical protein